MAISRKLQLELTYINNSYYNLNELSTKYNIKDFIKQNIEIENVYCKIDYVNGNKDSLTYKIDIYDSNKSLLIKSEVFTFIPSIADSSLRWDKQAYRHYKTIYPDSIDLLDEGQTS